MSTGTSNTFNIQALPSAGRCLGRQAMTLDPNAPSFIRYASSTLPTPPTTADNSVNVTTLGMMLNNKIGCCTIAAVGHGKQSMTATAKGTPYEVTVTDAQVLAEYEYVTAQENNGRGYNPVTGKNDNGCNMLDVCQIYHKRGLFGSTIDAFAVVNIKSQREVQDCIFLLCGIYLGVALPTAWEQDDGEWDVPDTIPRRDRKKWVAGSWGGHAIWGYGYDAQFVYLFTWGQRWKVTWKAFFDYFEEGYAILSMKDWLVNGQAPNGYDAKTLVADMSSF